MHFHGKIKTVYYICKLFIIIEDMKIAVAGTGYVGLSMATLLSHLAKLPSDASRRG